MPKLIKTCLTNISNLSQQSIVFLYGDHDFYSIPITSFTVNRVTGNNCPVSLYVPDTTTKIRFLEPISNCGIELDIDCGVICDSCDIGFDLYNINSVGLIEVGNLTGECQNNFTDYVIKWFGPGIGSNNVAFTSGNGSIFNYQYPHPLSGNTSIPVVEGVYTPVIDRLIMDNVTFSNDNLLGTVNVNFENCIPPMTVNPYRCDNQTNEELSYPYSNYSHNVFFEAIAKDSPPEVVFSFTISDDINFIPIAFQGYENPDRITIYFSGTNYNELITLEDVVIGLNTNTSNFSDFVFPKIGKTDWYHNKILTLTNLNINNNDKIIFKIRPASRNTLFNLYFSCLIDYDCSICWQTKPYRIIKSSLYNNVNDCGRLIVNYTISGCTFNELKNSDYFNYYKTEDFYDSSLGLGQRYLIFPSYFLYLFGQYTQNNEFGNFSSCSFFQSFYNPPICSRTNSPTAFKDSILPNGNKLYSFSGDSSTISSFYSSWLNAKTFYNDSWTNLDFDYYRFFTIRFPTGGFGCDDSLQLIDLDFHPTTPVETGTTGNYYYINFTAITITKNINFNTNPCETSCESAVNAVVNSVNYSNQGSPQYDHFFNDQNKGVYFVNPVYIGRYLGIVNQTKLSHEVKTFFTTFDCLTNTKPFSGITNSYIPSLSGSVCTDYSLWGEPEVLFGTIKRKNYLYKIIVSVLGDPSNGDFKIEWNDGDSNFISGNYNLIYLFSGGTEQYIDNNYFI